MGKLAACKALLLLLMVYLTGGSLSKIAGLLGLLPISTGIFSTISEKAKEIEVDEDLLEILEEKDIFPSNCSIFVSVLLGRI